MLEYLAQERIIFTYTFGKMSQQELIKLAEEAFAMGAEFGVDRYHVDHLDMTPDLDTFDIVDLPKIHQPLGISGNVRVAAVYGERHLKKKISSSIQCGPGARAYTISATIPICNRRWPG